MKLCSIEGCENRAIKRGWCSAHYQRWQRHGDPLAGRSGNRMNDPRWPKWDYHQRDSKTGIVDEWRDFDAFCQGVGHPPGNDYDAYQLMKIAPSLPMGPENFRWHRKYEGHAERMRDWRKKNPDRWRKQYLWTKYRVTPEWYDETLKAQGGVCAICEQECERVQSGKIRYMPVDHCHETGRVRAILCDRCNTGLGRFRDDPALLRKAADYLS